MNVLGIESTCDETGCAIVRDGQEILSNVVASQIDLHKEYGGVVPELACRRHIDVIIPIIDQSLQNANILLDAIDLIAVAHGPGLIGALLIGLNTAKSLSLSTSKPLIGVNHIEAHLYAALMSNGNANTFPSIGVVLSGGHTSIVLIKDIGNYQLIGQTVDDAIGEAFDKVAKIMDIPYPGGPQIEALAKKGNPDRYLFKSGTVKKRPLDFSFSGIKTKVLYTIKGQDALKSATLNESDKYDIAASFQKAVFDDVLLKVTRASEIHRCQTIVFGGGVTCNQTLRNLFTTEAPHLTCIWPPHALTMDNAAMIAGLGYHTFQARGESDPYDLEASCKVAW